MRFKRNALPFYSCRSPKGSLCALLPTYSSLHLPSSTCQFTKSFTDTHSAHGWGGQWEITAPWQGSKEFTALKVFFCAMPFPARQQGGLTGDYVSLPGYTETKRRVRQDILPPALSYLFSPTDSLPAAFDTPSSQVPLSCSETLTLFLQILRGPLSSPGPLSSLCFIYTLHCPPQPFVSYVTSYFLQLKA